MSTCVPRATPGLHPPARPPTNAPTHALTHPPARPAVGGAVPACGRHHRQPAPLLQQGRRGRRPGARSHPVHLRCVDGVAAKRVQPGCSVCAVVGSSGPLGSAVRIAERSMPGPQLNPIALRPSPFTRPKPQNPLRALNYL